MGTTSALLFTVALVLDVGPTELPSVAVLALEGGTPLLSFVLMLLWGNRGITETDTTVLSVVSLPAELLRVGNTVTCEGTKPWDPLPLVFWEVALFRVGVITVVSVVVVSTVVVSVVVVSVVVVSVVVVSVVVVVFKACVPKGQRGSGTGATASIWEEILHEAPS